MSFRTREMGGPHAAGQACQPLLQSAASLPLIEHRAQGADLAQRQGNLARVPLAPCAELPV